jgi:hypothetical protein
MNKKYSSFGPQTPPRVNTRHPWRWSTAGLLFVVAIVGSICLTIGLIAGIVMERSNGKHETAYSQGWTDAIHQKQPKYDALDVFKHKYQKRAGSSLNIAGAGADTPIRGN